DGAHQSGAGYEVTDSAGTDAHNRVYFMGQKVNPIGFRTGIMIGWKSRWYASKQEFSDLLIEDLKIRKFSKEKYKFAGIPKIEIERTRDEVKVIMHTARPGVI